MFAVGPGAGLAATPVFSIQDLKTLGGADSAALSVNATGWIVGWARNDRGQIRAARWQPGGLIEDLLPGSTPGVAAAVNVFNEVVGTVTTADGRSHAFLRSRDGFLLDLSYATPHLSSAALGINDIDLVPHVVGRRDLRDARTHGFRLSTGAAPGFDLLFSDLGADTEGRAINNADQVAGTRYTIDSATGVRRSLAFRWSGGSFQLLETPGGADSEGTAINAAGTVAGWMTIGGVERGDTRACVWARGKMLDLKGLGGGFSQALGLNNLGDVVGSAFTPLGQRHAFLFTGGLGLLDLNAAIDTPSTETWELQEARAINDVGWIVGIALHNGASRAFLMQPIGGEPVPAPPEGADRGSPPYTAPATLSVAPPPITRLGAFNPTSATWTTRNVTGQPFTTQFGARSDVPVPGDYLGTGRAQLALYRPSTAEWLVRKSGTEPIALTQFGKANDIPVPADYLGSGRWRLAVFRPSTAEWLIRKDDGSTIGPIQFGESGDLPVPGDYLGRGTAQLAVFRPKTGGWLIRDGDLASTGTVMGPFALGATGDIPVPADYLGTGLRIQMAVFRPNTAEWLIRKDDGSTIGPVPFGKPNDIPVPGRYSSPDRAQIAVCRSETAEWFIRTETDPQPAPIRWGAPGDRPVPAAYPYEQ